MVDPKPLNPGTLHSSSLLPSPAPTCSNFPKTWARDQDSVPRKGHRIPRDSPFCRLQPGNLAAQSQSSCSALPAPYPSPPRPEVGREGLGWFTSSPIVFQTMGKVPLSQTRDSPLHRPKLGQRGEEGLWGKRLSLRPVGQRLRRVGEEQSKTKVSWVQSVPSTWGLDTGPNPQSTSSRYGTLVNQCLSQA